MTHIKKENIKYRTIASMLRGKAVEEGVRYAVTNGLYAVKTNDAQNYGLNYFHENKRDIPNRFYHRYEKQIPSMIRICIKTLISIQYSKNIKPRKMNDLRTENFVYPDFQTDSVIIDKKKIKRPIIELKTGEFIDHARVLRDSKQAIKYTTKRKRTCILLYLIAIKPIKKYDLYSANSHLFTVSKGKNHSHKINFK
ncbi:MAG: hypothetical protein ACJZ48_01735 [Candidatus Pelagibacterales bacterium]